MIGVSPVCASPHWSTQPEFISRYCVSMPRRGSEIDRTVWYKAFRLPHTIHDLRVAGI
ncbi:hypothetical protein M413DRAFT_447620 [Hebeloma cylindrosporum]|uniref:Uncharacterized protein n=1 Tax=Hebeloma cylindrosporum TaxID=76867 RepID=A0A0C3C4Y4_HEBCY|nr:hypothetical protein M413DRAFT_447620 [Hebeloma cylindrosporum h7]